MAAEVEPLKETIVDKLGGLHQLNLASEVNALTVCMGDVLKTLSPIKATLERIEGVIHSPDADENSNAPFQPQGKFVADPPEPLRSGDQSLLWDEKEAHIDPLDEDSPEQDEEGNDIL